MISDNVDELLRDLNALRDRPRMQAMQIAMDGLDEIEARIEQLQERVDAMDNGDIDMSPSALDRLISWLGFPDVRTPEQQRQYFVDKIRSLHQQIPIVNRFIRELDERNNERHDSRLLDTKHAPGAHSVYK